MAKVKWGKASRKLDQDVIEVHDIFALGLAKIGFLGSEGQPILELHVLRFVPDCALGAEALVTVDERVKAGLRKRINGYPSRITFSCLGFCISCLNHVLLHSNIFISWILYQLIVQLRPVS